MAPSLPPVDGMERIVCVVLCCFQLGGCLVYRLATPDRPAGGSAVSVSVDKKRSPTTRRAVLATVLGVTQMAVAGAAAYVAAGGVNVERGDHAPQDRWSGAASDAGKAILAPIFLGMVAAGLGISGLTDTVCGVSDFFRPGACEASARSLDEDRQRAEDRPSAVPPPTSTVAVSGSPGSP